MTDEQIEAAETALRRVLERYLDGAEPGEYLDDARDILAAAEAVAWQPIETAPKDGTLLDLWCVDDDLGNEPRRITNCSWGMVTNWLGHESFKWRGVKGRIIDWRPTHWRLPPEPPK